jgi:hypothetical protein
VRIEFRDVPLEKAQKDLLSTMVEAERAVSPRDRNAFLLIKVMGGGPFLLHAGLKQSEVYEGDLDTLADYGLLRRKYGSRGNEMFDVTPVGRQCYEWMKEQEGDPVERVETEVRSLIGAQSFRERHPGAYERWAAAEADLWKSDTVAQYTDIGHKCREAVQLFVTDLLEQHDIRDAEPDPQKTVARLKAVISKVNVSSDVGNFAEALLTYFGTVSDLIQRQEHGAQKEGDSLVWEDARRAVFQTAMVMFEIARALS